MPPKTQYARSGGGSVAYQVGGEGSIDLVLVPGFISHLDLDWANPEVTYWLRRLSSFSRLIRFDKRGTGLSDPVHGIPTLEERMNDISAVMDAAGSTRAALLGWSEGGPTSALFAATYPERTIALVMYGTFATGTVDERFPGLPSEPYDQFFESMTNVIDHWGEGRVLEFFAPSVADEELRKKFVGTYERASASPGTVRALVEAVKKVDVTDVLPSIRVPTLVLHRRDEFVPVEGARYIADHIPGARYTELRGSDHLPWIGETDAIVDEVEEFTTGARHAREPDRALMTLLVTDIVGSTERAAELGDTRWRELLARHEAAIREELNRFGGREVDRTGDGFLASFDGPARAMRCARAAVQAVRDLGIEIRAGVHTGECEVIGDRVGGIAVHIAARVAAKAGPGEVLVSSTVKDLVVGSGLEFEDRGKHGLKGVPGEWRLLAVTPVAPAARSSRETGGATEPTVADLDQRRTTRSDRFALWMAKRAPWLARSLGKLLLRPVHDRSERAAS